MRFASVSRIAMLSISMAAAVAVLRNQVDQGLVASGPRVVPGRTIPPVTTEIWLRRQP